MEWEEGDIWKAGIDFLKDKGGVVPRWSMAKTSGSPCMGPGVQL